MSDPKPSPSGGCPAECPECSAAGRTPSGPLSGGRLAVVAIVVFGAPLALAITGGAVGRAVGIGPNGGALAGLAVGLAVGIVAGRLLSKVFEDRQ